MVKSENGERLSPIINQGEQELKDQVIAMTASATGEELIGEEMIGSGSGFNCETFFINNHGIFIHQAKRCLMKCPGNRCCPEDVVSNYRESVVKNPNKKFLEADDEGRLKISLVAIRYKSLDYQEKCKCDQHDDINEDLLVVNPRNIKNEIEYEILLKEIYYYLPEDERFIFYCCMVVGYSHSTVGNRLGISANSVTKKVSQIKEKIRKIFDK